MAVSNAMFIFEVVVSNVTSLVESRYLVIRSDFADIFSLELTDPKQMHIVIPEPPPLPPEPPGKKKAKPKPKPKKGKKGKEEEPPPEPEIQSGQSVLFSSTPEFLIQSMNKFPLELSLWSKEDNFTYIGAVSVPWDPIFVNYLERLCNSEELEPITLKEEYNIFEEGKAKMMAKLGMQVKLSYLGDKVTTAFRTLSEDPVVKKVLYTGFNSKTTSYICNMKTTEENFIENCNKVENNYVVDKKPAGKIAFASYTNAPAANLTFFNEGDYCCMGHADKVPESIYKAPETCPDVDFIVDYVRKMVVSCNDNMRMLTPRPAIKPRVKATDIDRLCYCKETSWPDGKFAKMFRDDVQSNPCPICIDAGKKKAEGARGTTFDVANLRGPCGRPDCRIGRDLRAYIEKLVEEDNKEFSIDDIIGPCGSKSCTLAEKIQEFIRHEGVFKEGETLEGLSTQCACVQKMQNALQKKASCVSCCSKDCDDSDSEASRCLGKGCPFKKPEEQVYFVYYFTVEHDFDTPPSGTSSPPKSSNYKYCSTECPTVKSSEKTACSKSACSTLADKMDSGSDSKCQDPVCSNKEKFLPSPADSDLVIDFSNIHNPCCVKTCDAAERVKDFIVEGLQSKKHKTTEEDPCYCDCTCTFKFSKQKTTYCGVCGGYECLGDDMIDQPEYAKPHPCPIYHKLYDKHYIKTPNPWPEEDETKKQSAKQDTISLKSSRTVASRTGLSDRVSAVDRKSEKKTPEKKVKETKEGKKEKKQVGKFTTAGEESKQQVPLSAENKLLMKYPPYPKVPKNMGWNWTAEDIPGMKPRPNWKPGAANKILVRRYRAMREGIDIIAKKKRAMLQKKKKTDGKPTIIVKKQDGEYTVQMEVFKKYSKERLLFQYPYDDTPPLIYTIGKTEAEKAKIQKQRERKERRETRRKSRLLQSSFRDKCQEICLKAYNQAIGILPLPDPNYPGCPCQTEATQNLSPPIDSCSCSDEGSISTSDTDGDQWEIQFSPPAAKFDPKGKHPPVPADNESQYTYLDYKVKLLDKQGNQVPRYFKGPDGKQECSDLGGFWMDQVWMEINKDGYIGPDCRWVPMSFIGPDGMVYSAEEGSFRDNTGQVLKIGIDGWIDKNGKWVWYSGRPRGAKSAVTGTTVKSGKAGQAKTAVKGKGDAKGGKTSPPPPGKKKDEAKSNSPPGAKGKVQKTVSHASGKKNPLIMSVSVNYDQGHLPRAPAADGAWVDPKKMAKYKEIMQGLRQYDDFYELKTPMKSNRASNTPRKTVLSPPPYSLGRVRSFGNGSNRTTSSGSPIQSP